MLTKLFLAFSIGLLGAGGIATQSAFAIQQSALAVPVLEAVADAPLHAAGTPQLPLSAKRP